MTATTLTPFARSNPLQTKLVFSYPLRIVIWTKIRRSPKTLPLSLKTEMKCWSGPSLLLFTKVTSSPKTKWSITAQQLHLLLFPTFPSYSARKRGMPILLTKAYNNFFSFPKILVARIQQSWNLNFCQLMRLALIVSRKYFKQEDWEKRLLKRQESARLTPKVLVLKFKTTLSRRGTSKACLEITTSPSNSGRRLRAQK